MQRGCSADDTCRLRATTPQAVASRKPALHKQGGDGISVTGAGRFLSRQVAKINFAMSLFLSIFALHYN